MALQAQQVDIAQLQHVWVRSTVRHMARLASIDLYGSVLVHKRPLLVPMTCKAHRVLRRGGAHLLRTHRSMHVVAIAALD
jgi:hypothetical protein